MRHLFLRSRDFFRRVGEGKVSCPGDSDGRYEGNLELNGHDAEVEHLHRRPDNEVCFECRDIDVLELVLDCALATAFTDGHESEEASKTDRRKDELIKGHTLQSGKGVARTSNTNGECAVEEGEPPQLDRRHNTRVCHESDHPLKVEWRRKQLLCSGRQEIRLVGPWHLVGQLVDLDVEEVILVAVVVVGSHGVAASLLHASCCEGLCDRVCDTTEDGVGDHGCEERSCGIVGVELAHKYGDHGELDEEDDCVKQRNATLDPARVELP